MAETETGPAEREVMNLRFHQLPRLRIFDNKPETLTPQQRCQLLAVSSKYGFIFVGCDSGLKILKSADISSLSDQHQDSPNMTIDDYNYSKVALSTQPVNLALSPDDLILSVCSITDSGLLMALFDVRTLVYKSINAAPFAAATLSKETDSQLVNLVWNPGNPTLFATCLSNGNMALWDCSDDSLKMTALLPNDVEPTAMCWSPKGKQIVIGTSSGKLIQYNQKLEQKKLIPSADFSDEPIKVVDILWLSTYVFAVAYLDAEETLQPNLTIVNAPKEGRPTYANFEDVCFGNVDTRAAQYQLLNMDKWGFFIATSSNSMEVGLIGHSLQDKASWEIWTLDDAARLQMPLSRGDDETFPMGLALDLSPETNVQIGTKHYQAPPIVMLLSTEGVLCPFYVLNSDAMEPITTKAEPLPQEGERAASGQEVPRQIPANKHVAAPRTVKPADSFTASLPIHKSSSTGSFALGSSSSSSTPSGIGSAATGSSNSSGNFTPSGQKSLSSPATPSFLSGEIINRPDAGSGGNTSFMFGKTTDGKISGSTFLPTKPPVASTNQASITPPPATASFHFKVPGAQDITEKGLPIQQPASAHTTPQFGLPSQLMPSGSPLASGTQTSTAPASAFVNSQQKTAVATSTFGGGMQPQSMQSSFGQPQAPPTAQTATPQGGVPPNQTALARTGLVPNQIAPRFAPNQVAPGAPPNQVAPQSGFPNQVVPPGGVFKPPPPAYSASQLQRPAVPETKPPPPVQAPSTAGTGGRTRGSAYIDATPVEMAYLFNITAEMEHLTKELMELQSQMRRMHFRVGERSEQETIKKNSDDLVKFRAEVRVVTKSHNEEIHELKSKHLTTFAQLEDARTFKQRNNDPRYLQLLRIRGLDPQTAQQLRNIQSNYHYLETGLGDVNGCLDVQWEEFHQRKSRREGRKLGTPTMDTIYQTLSHHYNIMIAQRGKLEELRQQLIQARRYDITEAPWEKGMLASPPDRFGDLTSLAAKLSSTRIGSPSKTISTPVSSKKQSQLRKALSRRATTPRRTASRVDISVIDSPAPSHESPDGLYPAFANRRLRYQDEETTMARPTSRETYNAVDARGIRAATGFGQARPGSGTVAPVGLASRRQEGTEVRSGTTVELRQHAPVTPTGPPPTHPETPPSSTQPLTAATTSPSSFTHSGRATVVWGTQTTPLKTPPATRAPPQSAAPRKGVDKQPELPPVVNIKNLDVSQSARIPPPVTFATVSGSVDAGTAKVVNQVLAEMAKTSGYSQLEASEQIPERKISFSDEPLPIVHPVPPSKQILSKTAGGGSTDFSFVAFKPPVVQSLPSHTPVIPPAATTSPPTFGRPTSGLGLTFVGSGSMFVAKKEDSSTAISTTTQPASSSFSFSGGVGSAKATVASSHTPTATTAVPVMANTATSKHVFGGAGFTTSAAKISTSSSFTPTFPQQSLSSPSVGLAGASAATAPGVKPSLFDFKGQKSAASPSTPGGFFVAPTSSLKEPTQDQPTPSPATTFSVTEASPSKPTPNLGFGVKLLTTTPPAAQAVQPIQAVQASQAKAAVDALTSTSNAGGVGYAGLGQFGMSTRLAASATQGGLKQLLVGEDEAGTGLVSKPPSAPFNQPVGEDEAGTGRPTAGLQASDTYDNFPTAAAQPTTAAAASASGLFGKSAASDGTAGGLFGAKTATVASFGTVATVATAATPGSAAGFSAPSFGSTPSAGLFGAAKFGASSQSSVSTPAATTTTITAAAADKPKVPSTLFGLLKEDQPTAPTSGSVFGATTSTAPTSGSVFGATTSTAPTSGSVFGATTSTAPTSGSVFGATTSTAPTSGSVFGATTSTAPTSGSVFGATTSTAPTSGSVFGATTSTAPTSGSVFGATTSTAPTSGSVFGATTSSAPFSGSVFGVTTSTAPTSGSVFGATTSTAPTSGSVFGATTSTAPTSGSVFGATTSTAPTSGSVFGATTSTAPTSGSVFGATTSTASSSASKNLFGEPTSTSASPFGQSTYTSSGVFGQPVTSAASSDGLFGKTVPTSGGFFSQQASTASVFGQPAATSGGGIFGQSASTSSSPFQQTGSGSGGLFGTSSSSGPTFGQQSAGGFGGGSSSGPTFGQSPSVFGQTPATTPATSGIFGGAGGDGGGGFFSGLGGRPNPEAARSNPFGTPSSANASAFGGSSTGGSALFGSQGASTFGSGTPPSAATGSVFGGGFSSPEGGVAKDGFGGFNQPSATAGGFGSAPSFGSTQAFGSTPTFGGSAFGSSGAGQSSPFGQPSAFGASSPQPSAGISGGFGGFASQETATFGALSGTGSNPQQSGFGGFEGTGSSQPGFTGFGSSGQSSNTSSSAGFSGSSSFTQYR